MIVHNLQKLIEDNKPKARIAEKSHNQFTAEDIHVEVIFIMTMHACMHVHGLVYILLLLTYTIRWSRFRLAQKMTWIQ